MSNVSCSVMHQLLVNALSQTETWRPISTYISYYMPALRLNFLIQQDEGTTQLTTSNPIAIAVRVSRYTIFSPCVIKYCPMYNVKFCQSVRLMRLSIWYRPCSISTHWYYFSHMYVHWIVRVAVLSDLITNPEEFRILHRNLKGVFLAHLICND